MLKFGGTISLVRKIKNDRGQNFSDLSQPSTTENARLPQICRMFALSLADKQMPTLRPGKIFLVVLLVAEILQFTSGCHTESSHLLAPTQFISRSAWHAMQPNFDASREHGFFDAKTNPDGWLIYQRPLGAVLNTVVIHHSALPLIDGPEQIQNIHMYERGFADIGYHFVIDEDGRIFEGRTISARGCHTAGHNYGTIGVVLLGNFETALPPEKQLASMKALVRYLTIKYRLTHLAGHKDFQSGKTACPGKFLEALLPHIATAMGLEFGIAGYRGPPSQFPDNREALIPLSNGENQPDDSSKGQSRPK